MEVLQGIEIEGAAGSRSQIYEATHNRAGQRLPYMYRSFISFSYGGKNIEDFGLIAVTNGDRLSHAVYADFNDNVTDSNVLDGQLYWSTHFKANAWDLTLDAVELVAGLVGGALIWAFEGVVGGEALCCCRRCGVVVGEL